MVERTVDGTTRGLPYDRHRLAGINGPDEVDWEVAYDSEGTRVAVAGPYCRRLRVHYRLGGRRVGHRAGGRLMIAVTDLVGSTAALVVVGAVGTVGVGGVAHREVDRRTGGQ